ncbi:MAG: alanine--tRNA ligase [Candidatus Omnitrophica bacterium]|nr:alanine--tRNA ligase [Candidatus Omnitrophota bacterium]MDD5661956.1 alanine--tRNA ligase [Candidatus Omnitrophota bacterium]
MQVDSLREKFLEFFKSQKHKIAESDSLVPKDDPTVLFTPAGMNQFKKEFLGFDSGFKRAATSQRCLRTDDLDKVGKTSSHHTFFEMLGNFSFGDYFKDEAISWAWEFLTKELKIKEDKLWVSVYKDDAEAYKIWKDKIGIPDKKIIKLGDKDNFWPAEAKTKGPNGPCGPCSEIFYDFGADVGCGEKICDPSCSCGRFVEIWNLVFTQFNRKEDGSLVPLPNKNIDTGMGLERLASVMEGKQSNFETDLFEPIVKEIRKRITVKTPKENEFVYAIADHIRAVVFCVYDGVLPSNEGRGYVVRKIIRKSVLHLRVLGIEEPLLNKLVPLISQVMRVPYPDLKDRQEDIALVISNEEKNFINTLESSGNLFSKILLTADVTEIGEFIFKLYDTYGIPPEVTTDNLKKRGFKNLDARVYVVANKKLEEQKERSRQQSAMKGDVFGAKGLDIKVKNSKFAGYKENSVEAEILAILKDGEIVLDQTPFYAESGGQVGDTGKLTKGKSVFEVLDTQKNENVILHIGKVVSGSFKKGDRVKAQINIERRLNITRNHTATHILQAALRKVLGTHVQQQGSLVGAEKFRFDFAHFKSLSKEEIARVEEVANEYVYQHEAVSCKEMPLKEAKKAGALAFFEEKYGECVRVVSIGGISKELCGGTHLDNISKIGLIKIISEGSVASGIRRIEGATGSFAEKFIKEEEQNTIAGAKKKEQLKQQKEQEKKRNLEVSDILKGAVPRLINKGIKINGVNVVSSLEANLDMHALRLLADKVKAELKQGVIALGSQDNAQKRAYLVIAVTQDLLAKGLDAGRLIRQIAPLIGGSGGGRPDFAQAGGSKPENLAQALEELRKVINL